MKRFFVMAITLVIGFVILTGCEEPRNPSENNEEQKSVGKRLPFTLTIAETLPSCVSFEYKDGTPYCFYAYADEEKLYRVLWNDFTGLNEKDVISVDHNDEIKTLTYDKYPDGGFTPRYEITAISVKMQGGTSQMDSSVDSGTKEQTSGNVQDETEHFDDIPPHEALLNLEIMSGKLRFQRIATTPCIVYSNTPISDMSKGTVYDDRHDILTALFQTMDNKDAIMDISECEFSHYIYLFDKDYEDALWHYRFAICNCGAVMITNNDELLCTIKITDEERQSILNALK